MNRFQELCKAFDGISSFMDDAGWTTPSPWPLTAAALRDFLGVNYRSLPPPYEEKYLSPLLHHIGNVAARLMEDYNEKLDQRWLEPYARSYALLRSDSLLGAAVAWSDTRFLEPVQRFQAVVSDLFESFATKSHPVLDNLKLSCDLPPLVTFATQPAAGPATLNADAVRGYCSANVSIVAQPYQYAKHPLLWGVLAHETSGHAVTHAIPGLADELISKVPKTSGISATCVALWRQWAEEAAADVYGLLNIGPTFALSLGAWLKMAKPERAIGTSIDLSTGDLDDTHPPDLLRLYLLKGVVKALSPGTRWPARWLDDIQAAIDTAAEGVTHIDVYLGDPLHPQSMALAELGRDAEAIGYAIVTLRLRSLNDSRIMDIEVWSDTDEDKAFRVYKAAKAGRPLTGPGIQDAHLIAGATMALTEDATLCPKLNRLLGDALDDSYRTDKVFHGWCP